MGDGAWDVWTLSPDGGGTRATAAVRGKALKVGKRAAASKMKTEQ
jgi:hypothetical protein